MQSPTETEHTMKNIILVIAIVASLSPLMTASASMKSDASPVSDAVLASTDEGTVVAEHAFVMPEVTGSIAVPVRKVVANVHHNVSRKIVCDPVVYV
ncbi:MAG: hypothetical protein ACHQU0_03825, partial [Candidatus Paceibacteria bacterium]